MMKCDGWNRTAAAGLTAFRPASGERIGKGSDQVFRGGSASPTKPLIIDLPAEEVRRESETFAATEPAPAAPDIAPEGAAGEHAGRTAGTAPLSQERGKSDR